MDYELADANSYPEAERYRYYYYLGGEPCALIAAARPGRIFGGWYTLANNDTDENGTGTSPADCTRKLTDSDTITADEIKKARTSSYFRFDGDYIVSPKYEYIPLTVSFDGNGATSGTMDPVTNNYDSVFCLPKNDYVRTGCVFDGWATNRGGKVVFADGASVSGTNFWNEGKWGFDSKLFAVWTQNSFAVTVGSEGHGSVSRDPNYASYDRGTTVTLSAVPDEGYAFASWSDGSPEPSRTITVVSNASYTATFTNRVYAKTFDVTAVCEPKEAGSVSIEGTQIEGLFVDGTEIVLAATPSNGYSFAYWKKGQTVLAGNPLTATVTGQAEYAAVFTGNVYEVYFDANGGRFEGGSDGLRVPYSYGQPFGSLPTCTQEGSDFRGWFTKKSSDEGEQITADDLFNVDGPDGLRLFAHWTLRPAYTIAFDGNGATGGTMPSQKAYCGVPTNLPLNTYVKGGCAFLGWSTNETDSIDFADGAAVADLVAEGQTCTLRALWRPLTLSEAMHCVNLTWTSVTNSSHVSATAWTVVGGEGVGYEGSGSCVRQEAEPVSPRQPQILIAPVSTNGTLSFQWKGYGEKPLLKFNLTDDPDTPGMRLQELSGGNDWSIFTTNITCSKEMWVHIYNSSSSGAVDIDRMTWTPEGTPPEPEPVVTNAVPVAVTGLVYDGTEKTGVAAGANYTIAGNVATNAGGYTATATVTNGVWAGGATGATNITWTIAKATVDMGGVTFASATYEFDGEEHAIAVAGVPSGVEVVYTGDATNRTEVGTNTVTASFRVLDELNYNAITTQMTATLSITKTGEPPPPPPPPSDPTMAYEGIYFKATLAELGADAVPTNRKITITAEGLPKGLKLVTTAFKDENKKVTGHYAYTVEGAPTETMDGLSRIAYVRVTDNKVQTLYALDLSVLWARAYEDKSFPDGEVKSEYANFSVTNLWPDVAVNPKDWTFSGWPTGIKFTTKAVTSRTKIDGVYVTQTNALAYEIYGTPTKAGRFTMKAVEKIAGTPYKSTHVATFTVWPEGSGPADEWTDQAYVEVHRGSATDVKSASGLPTGIKFTVSPTRSFHGTPTKAGTYAVTLTHEDKSKTRFLWTITPANPPAFALGLTETSVDPETVKATIRQGVAYEWTVTNTPGSKVSASGLPSGLSLKSTAIKDGKTTIGYAYSVKGVPTKAGEYLVTFKTTMNGVTVVTTAAFKVLDLPAWAQGTFDGGADESFAAGGQVKLAASKAGKLSGKWMSAGTNWTLSAASYDRYDPASGSYVALMIGKTGSGKKAVAFTNELVVSETNAEFLGGVATNPLFVAYQNVWKTEPWKTIGKKFAKGGTVVLHPGTVGTNDTITLKFAASGTVTAAGKFEKSVDSKGRVSYYSVSASAVLCPQGDPDGDGAFDGVVFVYFPPKAGTPLSDGYSACVWVRWDGSSPAELPPANDE